MSLLKLALKGGASMEIQQYLERLNEDKEFEGGLLSGLCEETPQELHNNIIRSVEYDGRAKKERMKKLLKSVAAVFILVFALSTARGFLEIGGSAKKTAENVVLSGANQKQDSQEKQSVISQDSTMDEKNLSKKTVRTYKIYTSNNEAVNFLNLNAKVIDEGTYAVDISFEEAFRKLAGNNQSYFESTELLENLPDDREYFIVEVEK